MSSVEPFELMIAMLLAIIALHYAAQKLGLPPAAALLTGGALLVMVLMEIFDTRWGGGVPKADDAMHIAASDRIFSVIRLSSATASRQSATRR